MRYPEISLVRPKEDECNGCFANTELSNTNISPERKAEPELLKRKHIGAVVVQPRAMQAFIKMCVSKKNPDQLPLPDILHPDYLSDDEHSSKVEENSDDQQNRISHLIRGSLRWWYWASSLCVYQAFATNYYNSNLILQNFLVSDIVSKKN